MLVGEYVLLDPAKSSVPVFPLEGFRVFLWTAIMVGLEEDWNTVFSPLYQKKKNKRVASFPFLQAAVRFECLPQFALSYTEWVGRGRTTGSRSFKRLPNTPQNLQMSENRIPQICVWVSEQAELRDLVGSIPDHCNGLSCNIFAGRGPCL